MKAVVKDFEWGAHDRILDIGGAHGSVLAALLAANPAARGVLFDLPQVVEEAKKVCRICGAPSIRDGPWVRICPMQACSCFILGDVAVGCYTVHVQ